MKLATFLFAVLSLSCVSAKGLAKGRSRAEDLSQPVAIKSRTPRGLQGGKKGGTDNSCDVCSDGRPDTLSLRYELPSATSTLQPKSTCVEGDYPEIGTVTVEGQTFAVENGTEFIIVGPFEANTDFLIVGDDTENIECSIHTSCSQPLVGGDKIGPFLILEPDGCDPIPDDCIICDQENKQRPDELSFIYNSTGANSAYQDENKATCRADTYPSNPTTITALDKSGNVLGVFLDISDGDSFTVFAADGDTLDAETTFAISGWDNGDGGDDCFIHTSCSQPLVQDDQIGPFIVTAGNDCFTRAPTLPPRPPPPPPTSAPSLPPCMEADKATYECGESISVTFNFGGIVPVEEPLIDDWVGIYPCDVVVYTHAQIWQWTCGPPEQTPRNGCVNAQSEGVILFDSLPAYDQSGPHKWPVAPFVNEADVVNRCFKAVLMTDQGPSTPPYTPYCESTFFDIIENGDEGCAIRDSSISF
jgi:hypothetical protein